LLHRFAFYPTVIQLNFYAMLVRIVQCLYFFVIRLANDSKGKGGERQFNGLVDVYVKTIKSDGIQGLYRGFVISAVGIFIYRYGI
jgi:hypothetical protein